MILNIETDKFDIAVRGEVPEISWNDTGLYRFLESLRLCHEHCPMTALTFERRGSSAESLIETHDGRWCGKNYTFTSANPKELDWPSSRKSRKHIGDFEESEMHHLHEVLDGLEEWMMQLHGTSVNVAIKT